MTSHPLDDREIASPARSRASAASEKSPDAVPPAFWLPVASLCWRELVRFYRQRSRVVGALATPLLIWVMAGAGFGKSFRAADAAARPAGTSYIAYLFPGTILLIVMFTSIFSTISVIEDRHEGFLLSVLVAPVSRAVLVLGKVLGGTALALIQGVLLLVLAPLVGIRLGLEQVAEVIGILALISFALTALGFYFAWRLDSVQGFHSVMNLLMMPMWVLSGAIFPLSGAHTWIAWLMRLNPLTYGLNALDNVFYGTSDAAPLTVSIAVMSLFAALVGAAGFWEVSRSPVKART